MATKKFSQLPAATLPLSGTEIAAIVQSGESRQVAVSEFGGGGGASDLAALMLGHAMRFVVVSHFGDLTVATFGFSAPAEDSPGAVASVPTLAPGTSLRDSIVRYRVNSATTANSGASIRSAQTKDAAFRAISANAKGGGFDLIMLFGWPTAPSGCRYFAGYTPATTIIGGTSNPSALLNCLGFAKDDGDTNLFFIHNDGSGAATKVNLGVAISTVAGKLVRLKLSCAPPGTTVTYSLKLLDTDQEFTGSVNSDLPAVDTGLFWQLWANSGNEGGTAVSAELARLMELRPQ